MVNLSPSGTPVNDVSPVGNISRANGGITYLPGDGPQPPGNAVVGPARFVALGGGCNGGCVPGASNLATNVTSSDGSGSGSGVEPLTFTIGVPANPAPNGSTFNIQYAEATPRTAFGRWMGRGQLATVQHLELGSVIRALLRAWE